MADKRVTVSELIDILSKAPQAAIVELEGCDCAGEASGEFIVQESHLWDSDSGKYEGIQSLVLRLLRSDR